MKKLAESMTAEFVAQERGPSRNQELSAKLTKAEAEIKKLRERSDGSLFDLKRDSASDIGETIADNISESKFDAVTKAAKARYKAKAKRPAG